MTTSEKVAYLKGLTEGLGITDKNKEGKLFTVITDILAELATDIEDLAENAWDLGEAIDQVSDDLSELEDLVYDELDLDYDEDYDYDEDEDEDDFDGCGCGCGCGDDEEPMFYEVTCPACENTITIDEDVLMLGAIDCPGCSERLEFLDPFSCDDEDCDCGCEDGGDCACEKAETEE